ncbi:MAG: LacI family DNA-binding transcriptional regulator [Planctomycetota bacterium]
MNDIADACGCSRATVNHILLGHGDRFAPATRRRVMDTAARLGYRVNSSARAIKTGRFDCVSLILGPRVELGTVPMGLLTGMEERFARRGIHLTLCHAFRSNGPRSPKVAGKNESEPAAVGVPKIIQQSIVDGHLVIAARFDRSELVPDWVDKLDQGPLPVVKLGVKRKYDCAYVDDEQGGFAATHHLIELGHRDIACVGGHTKAQAAIDRRAGYARAMASAGLEPRYLTFDIPSKPKNTNPLLHDEMIQSVERLAQCTEWLKNKASRPTAMFGVWATDALSIQTAAHRLQIDLPSDLSLIAVHDYFVGLGSPIATYCVNSTPLGRKAAEMMMTKLDQPGEKLSPAVQPYQFAGGLTAGPPKT